MKRTLYIGLFVLLGILVQFLLHALLEMGMLHLLFADFERYSLGLSWAAWEWIHHIGSAFLLAGGILFGYRQGTHWWHRVYKYN